MSFVIAAIPFMQVDLVSPGANPGETLPVEAFAIAPTSRSNDVMQDHSIIFRGRPDGFSLFYVSNPEAQLPPVAEITTRTRFSFIMRLIDDDFFDRFHPDFPAGVPQLLLDNLDAGGAIRSSGALSAGATVEAADTVSVGHNPYVATADLNAGAPAQIDVRDRFSGTVIATTEFLPEPTATSITVPVEIPEDADPAVRLTAAAPSTLDLVVYADNAPSDAGSAGVIDLYWDQSQTAVPANTGALFTTTFRPRS